MELALLHAASALDALVLIDHGAAFFAADRLLRADLHAGVLQTALAHVGHFHDVVGTFVAGKLDHVHQRGLIVAFGVEREIDAFLNGRVLGDALIGKPHRETHLLGDHGALGEDAVAVFADLAGHELVRQLAQGLGVVAALVGQAGDLRKYRAADARFRRFHSLHG